MAYYERDRQNRAARKAAKLISNYEASCARISKAYDQRQYDKPTAGDDGQ